MRALMFAVITSHPRQSVATFVGTAAFCAIIINALFLQPGLHPAPLFASRIQTSVPARPLAAMPATQPVALPRPRVIDMTPAAAPRTPAAPRDRAQIITDIQRELSRKGFYDGVVDGIWGSRTEAALREFSRSTGVALTSEASEEVLRQVSHTSAAARSVPDMPAGAAHRDPIAQMLAPSAPQSPQAQPAPQAPPLSRRLAAVQSALADFGYGQVKPTGTMGPETQAAIERFERDRKLPVSGQLSDRVLRELAAVTGRPLE